MKSLDDEIHTTLAMLRRRINIPQSPIYRLPSDVFSEVASHLRFQTADLVRFTHVSYRLRAALLTYPRLWSYIDSDSNRGGERAQAFLRRSRQTPLHLHVNQVGDRHPEFPLLPSQMARLVSLEICDCRSQKEYMLSQPMPALRRLEIVKAQGFHWGDGDAGGVEDSPLWSLTSLTSLIVRDVASIRLHAPRLTRLGFVHGEEEARIDPLLEFLDNCPLLEDLYVSYNSEPSSYRDRPVSLPNLRNYTQRTCGDRHSLRLFNTLSHLPARSVTLKRVTQPAIVTVADVIPPFRNPDCLDDITRVKLKERCLTNDFGITGTLELIGAKGVKVSSERTVCRSSGEYVTYDESNLAHMGCLRDLDTRAVEIICLEGYRLWDDQGQFVVDDVRKMLGRLPSLTTLILSLTTVEPCLLVLDIDPDAESRLRYSPSVHTLVIHSGFYRGVWPDKLHTLLTVARRRKAAGTPFNSVSLFLLEDPLFRSGDPRSRRILDQLRACVGEFEVTVGDDVLGWDVDRYFLAGLDHLRDRRDVWWGQVDDGLSRVGGRDTDLGW